MARIADPLREWALAMSESGHGAIWADQLMPVADQIDAEHERRMGQCRRETKRAAMRYLNGVIVDYAKHGMKRSRADMLARYERKRGRHGKAD